MGKYRDFDGEVAVGRDAFMRRCYPVRVEVKAADRPFCNYEPPTPWGPVSSSVGRVPDHNLVCVRDELARRTRLIVAIIQDDVRDHYRAGMVDRVASGRQFWLSHAELGFCARGFLQRAWTNRVVGAAWIEKTVAFALSEPALWDQASLKNISSIKLGKNYYSYNEGKVSVTKTEPRRPIIKPARQRPGFFSSRAATLNRNIEIELMHVTVPVELT